MARAWREPDRSPSARLSDGRTARIVPAAVTTGFELEVDGVAQSHVDPADPAHLHFEYVARMAALIDLVRMPGQPVRAVHLGAGAMTIPRYVAHTRPGSVQHVLEREPALAALVAEQLPLPAGADVRIRFADAREGLPMLAAEVRRAAPHDGDALDADPGGADLLVSDVFAGPETPAHVTTIEFYRDAAALLAPDGLLLVNVADGGGLAHARAQVATVRAVLEHVMVLAERATIERGRFGNVVVAASAAPMPAWWAERLRAAGPFPASALAGADADRFAGGARPVRDGAASPSPRPWPASR